MANRDLIVVPILLTPNRRETKAISPNSLQVQHFDTKGI